MAGNGRGAALILALLIVVLLAGLILEFDRMTRTDLMAAGNFRDGVKAAFLAKAGIEAGRGLLQEDALRGNPYDGPDELWGASLAPLSASDGSIAIRIEDEAGKLNPNHLLGGPAGKKIPAKVAQMRRLIEALDLDPHLVDVLVDWIDPDAEPEPFGAEEGYYRGLDPPYRAKNAHFESLSELHLLKGVTDEVYRTLTPYLTVATPAPGKININTADPLVLRALDPRISHALADRIVKARPFRRIEDLDRVSGMTQIAKELRGLEQAYDIRSDTFLITSRGRVRDTSRLARATVVRSQIPQKPVSVRVVSWRVDHVSPADSLRTTEEAQFHADLSMVSVPSAAR